MPGDLQQPSAEESQPRSLEYRSVVSDQGDPQHSFMPYGTCGLICTLIGMVSLAGGVALDQLIRLEVIANLGESAAPAASDSARLSDLAIGGVVFAGFMALLATPFSIAGLFGAGRGRAIVSLTLLVFMAVIYLAADSIAH